MDNSKVAQTYGLNTTKFRFNKTMYNLPCTFRCCFTKHFYDQKQIFHAFENHVNQKLSFLSKTDFNDFEEIIAEIKENDVVRDRKIVDTSIVSMMQSSKDVKN